MNEEKKIMREAILGAVARGWCAPSNATKEMDGDLVRAIADEVEELLASRSRAEGGHGDEKDLSAAPAPQQGDMSDDQINAAIIKSGVMDKSWPTQTALHAFARDIEKLVKAAQAAPSAKAEPASQKLVDAAMSAAEKWSQKEHLHARNIGRGGPGSSKAVKRAEREARAAIKALAPTAPDVRDQVLHDALQPFAELAELFDAENRGSNMPGKDEDPVMQWPRLHKDYVLTVGHLRTARKVLASPTTGSEK